MRAFQEFGAEWGIVLGSGLGAFVDKVAVSFTVPFVEVVGIPVSTVPGHAGQFLFGHLGQTPVVVAQGRVHLYEGYSAEEVTAPVRFLGEVGVEKLVLTNAAGLLNEKFQPGSWMALSDHLNLTGDSPLIGPNFIDLTEVYSTRLRSQFAAAAEGASVPLCEGVYASMRGPQYETPAEVRMLQTMGADAVGMSTVLEAIQARALGIETVAFSCLTNWAAGLSDQGVSHDDVLEVGKQAALQFSEIAEAVITA